MRLCASFALVRATLLLVHSSSCLCFSPFFMLLLQLQCALEGSSCPHNIHTRVEQTCGGRLTTPSFRTRGRVCSDTRSAWALSPWCSAYLAFCCPILVLSSTLELAGISGWSALETSCTCRQWRRRYTPPCSHRRLAHRDHLCRLRRSCLQSFRCDLPPNQGPSPCCPRCC